MFNKNHFSKRKVVFLFDQFSSILFFQSKSLFTEILTIPKRHLAFEPGSPKFGLWGVFQIIYGYNSGYFKGWCPNFSLQY